jgi:hypothetical protein
MMKEFTITGNKFTLELEYKPLQGLNYLKDDKPKLCHFCKNKSDYTFVSTIKNGRAEQYNTINVCLKHLKRVFRKNKSGGYTFSMPISNIDLDDLECS